MSKLVIFSLLFFTTTVGVIADSLIKDAANKTRLVFWNSSLAIGLILYIVVALLWYSFAKNIKLTTVGVVYPFFSMLLYTVFGLVYFKEKINTHELFGIGFGVISIYLLSRNS